MRPHIRIARALLWALVVCGAPSTAVAKAPAGRYVVSSGGGVVTDAWTKLQWQRQVVAGKKTWQAAKDVCAGLSLEGGGWRLPWVRELHGLVDKQEVNPSIDKVAFLNTPVDWFWSASLRAGAPSSAWAVYFYDGSVSYGGVSSTPREVRCVRGS